MEATEHIKSKLSDLSKEKQLTFGLLAAERFFICYKIFSEKENFGNIPHLTEAINLIEAFIVRGKLEVELIKKCMEKVDKSTPDMEDFGSINSSIALNVSCIIYEALGFILNNEERIPYEFSTYGTDSIDFLISAIEGYDQMDFEKFLSHPLMKEEIRLQEGIIEYLKKIETVDSGDMETLRLFQKETEFYKLKLMEVFAE